MEFCFNVTAFVIGLLGGMALGAVVSEIIFYKPQDWEE